MKEVERLKVQKLELEALSDNTILPKERNMKVCEVCGALQSTTDTDKRLVMHLEGKLHTGYLKVRKVLGDLKAKKEEYRRMGRSDRGGRRSRSRSLSPRALNNKNRKEADNKEEEHFNFSSRRYGTGVNVPPENDLAVRFSDRAIEVNN
jgi:hypothetical protein